MTPRGGIDPGLPFKMLPPVHDRFLIFSTDWVDVANDLLSKCHINLRLKKLTDCDANTFIALYENILGETVPGNLKININKTSKSVSCSENRVSKYFHKKPHSVD